MATATKPWWKQPLRIIQPNLQVRDTAQIDPERLAAQLKEMGANAIVFNTGGIYAWYRTAVPYHTVNPYLEERENVLAETIAACHRHNIRFIARFDFSKAEDSVYLRRPEWFVRRADGGPEVIGARRPGPWPLLMNTCINGDYRSGAVAAPVLEEVLAGYDIDGIFFNAPGYMFCRCERCAGKYRGLYGKELPQTAGELEPGFASRCLRDNMAGLYRLVKQKRGEVPVILYYQLHGEPLSARAETADLLCTEPQDVLSLGHANIPEFWKPAVSVKLGRSLPDRPAPLGIVHSCPGMDWRHTGLPTAEYRFWLAQIPANGGHLWHSLTGVPDTISDKRILQTVAELNAQAAKVAPYMEDAVPVSQVALLWSAGPGAAGWADALINKQIPFDVMTPEQIGPDRLARYKAVIVPEGYACPETLAAQLKDYASAGGWIVAEGAPPPAGLTELFGIECEIFLSEPLIASYLRFEGSANPLQAGLEQTELIPHRGRVAYCRPRGEACRVLATLVPPFSPLESVGAPPERASLPAPRTDLPLALRHAVGRGGALFFPFSLSGLINEYRLEEHYRLLENSVNMILGEERLVSVSSYQGLQLTLFRKGRELLLHLVNGAGRRPLMNTLPLHELEVELMVEPVRDGESAYEVLQVIRGDRLQSRLEGNRLRFTVPRLDNWECLRISLRSDSAV